jgi:Domain of unknown function (DUF4468) with TBP-like fold
MILKVKIGIIFVLLLVPFFVAAQENKLEIPVEKETGLIKFREVVEVEGTKNDLFDHCIYWLNDFYKDPTRVTTIRDVATGKIVGNHHFRIYYEEDGIKKPAGMIRYTFTIEFKDNKYRYTVDDFLLESMTNMPVEKWLDKNDPAYDPRWDSYLQQIAQYVKGWSDNLKEKMKLETKKPEDNW